MIIATSSLSYRNDHNVNFAGQIESAKNDGFSAIELHACFREPCISRKDLDAISREAIPVSVHAHYENNNIASLDSEIRDASVSQIMDDIIFAEAIKAALVVVHPGSYQPGYKKAAYGQLNKSLQELLPFACEHQIVFTLENMDGTENKLFSSYQEVQNILTLHPKLKLTVDLAHLAISRQDIYQFLHDFGQRIYHFHISGYIKGIPHSKISLQESKFDFGPFLYRIKDLNMMMTIENSDRLASLQSRAFIENAFQCTTQNTRQV